MTMKRETKEYHYDWNLWTILENAAKTYDGSRKEYETLLPYVHHYKDVLDNFVRQGNRAFFFKVAGSVHEKLCHGQRKGT